MSATSVQNPESQMHLLIEESSEDSPTEVSGETPVSTPLKPYPQNHHHEQIWEQRRQETLDHPEKVPQVARMFADQIAYDAKNCFSSPAAFVSPAVDSGFDKKTGLGRAIAFLLRPPKDPEVPTERVKSYINYTKTRSPLRKKFKTMSEILLRHKAVMKKQMKARALFCLMKNSDRVSTTVQKPEAMPVEVAPHEELEPFFSFLRESGDLPLDAEHWESQRETLKTFPRVKEVDAKQVEFPRGVVYNDGRMDMCKQVVGRDHIGELLASIQKNPNIKHFLMGNNIAGGDKIAQFLKEPHMPKIETWYLAGNDIDGREAGMLAEALKGDLHCTALWLKRNPLGIEGAAHLAEMLETNHRIQVLDLFNCNIQDEGAQILFRSLQKNRGLQHLYLGANALGVESARAMGEYFTYLTTHGLKGLDSLKVTVNRLGDEGALLLAEGLRGYPHLQRLALSSNRLEARGVVALVEVLKTMPDFQFLDLGYFKSTFDFGELPNQMTDEGAKALVELIRTSTTLRGLNLTNNRISVSMLQEISDAIRDSKSLCFLEFSQYDLKIPKELQQEIRARLMKNFIAHYGEEQVPHAPEKYRLLRGREDIWTIDSVYRNRAMGGSCCAKKAKA